jgi:hypothetical protein
VKSLRRRLAGALMALVFLAGGLAAGPAAAEFRTALVIGNGAYATAPLRNPVNDARAMAEALGGMGFDVIARLDADRAEMQRAVVEFGRRLKEKGGVGLFYYAGHGVQVQGANYLIPLGAQIAAEEEVAIESVDVNYVLSRMDAAHNRLNIVILDACRNNPFARSFRSTANGLASIDAPAGTLIAYATAPGSVAADGEGSNGLYTGELVQAMKLPGLKVEDVFKQVRIRVQRQSKGSQVPWESSSLTGDFYFAGEPPAMQTAALVPAAAPAPDFSVRLNAIEYRNGDRMEIGIEAARPAYVAVYRWLPYEKGVEQVSRLFPNQLDPVALVSGSATIPSAHGRERYDLVVRFPEQVQGRQVEERLIFLASDKPLDLKEGYSLDDFNAMLRRAAPGDLLRIDRAYVVRR